MINHLRRRSGSALLAVGALVALTACSTATADTEADGPYPLTIENCGTDLKIPSEPTSVMTIGTSAIALLDVAGVSERITARSGEFGAELPEGLENPPTDAKVVDPSDPTAESIIGAEPDVIVGYGLFNAAPKDIAAAGIPEIVIDGECSHDTALMERTDFDAIFADVERLAAVFGTQTVAEDRLAELRAELSELTAAVSTDSERGTAAVVYYFSESSTLSARGGQGIADDILDRAGFDNVYADEPSVYLEVNVETLLDANPDTVVVAYGLFGESFEDAKAHLLSEPGVTDLAAVQADRIIGVPAADLSPDPGALRGLRAVLEGTGRISQ